MKLVSFRAGDGTPVRIGAPIDLGSGEQVLDLTSCYGHYLREVEGERFEDAALMSAMRVPGEMISFLDSGERALTAARRALDHARDLDADELRRWHLVFDPKAIRWLPPVPRPGKIISVGLNYAAHVSEAGDHASPGRPAAQPAFGKFPSTLVGHGEPIVMSKHTSQLDYELELCLVIGRRCKYVPAERWLDAVAGFAVFNDVSMRDIQFEEMKAGLLCMGKNLDTAAPMGPYLVTSDEIENAQELDIRLTVNGQERQHDNTRNMIFKLPEIVEYWSRMTLEPGDVITTGSPAGVAAFSENPAAWYLKPGDVVEAQIEGLGVLRNQVVAEEV